MPLSVYYDGLCPLCSREIEHYRKRRGASEINWIDISDEDFDAKKEGLDPGEVHKVFHIKTINGKILKGVDAFIEIWKAIPSMRPLAEATRIPGVRPVMKAGYFLFARVRPFLPRKKRVKKDGCSSGLCDRYSTD